VSGFSQLLKRNANYRSLWLGQIVSEAGDNFNNIAVFALVLEQTNSGFAVAAMMLARAAGVLLAGPVAGVALDRFDRRKAMLASDLARAALALAFILTIGQKTVWLLLSLSALLMFASPFFTSGRASILPAIASKEELHAANSLTQTTQWSAVVLGAFLGGAATEWLGYAPAFIVNSLSFLVSAACVWRMRAPHGASFLPDRPARRTQRHPLHDYAEGLRYMRRTPLVLMIALVGVGWATGGGAAQILFGLFGKTVFSRGAAGIGEIWGSAGIGLIVGGVAANTWGRKLSFESYRRTIPLCYLVHGGSYVLFSLARWYPAALFFIALSRAAVAVSSVLNMTQVLRHVPDGFRGRVFTTMESMVWAAMVLSMTVAGAASETVNARTIGVAAGVLSSTTAVGWLLAHARGKLVEPASSGKEAEKGEEVQARAGS
jgi:MFS family permease